MNSLITEAFLCHLDALKLDDGPKSALTFGAAAVEVTEERKENRGGVWTCGGDNGF